MVRAKFKLDRTESVLSRRQNRDTREWESVELKTLVLSPVYDSRPDSENGKFFSATPCGEIKMGVVNPEAWGQFELGKEYYVDFTLAEGSGEHQG